MHLYYFLRQFILTFKFSREDNWKFKNYPIYTAIKSR